MGPPKASKFAVCRWFNGIWCEHKPSKQFSTLYKSKMENFAKHFFDIVTTYNDETLLCKAFFSPLLCVFHPIWVLGGWGVLSRGLGRNLLMQFSRLNGSKMEISETDFFDTLTIQNDQISHVKHVLAPFYVFFTLFGCWGGGGCSQGV